MQHVVYDSSSDNATPITITRLRSLTQTTPEGTERVTLAALAARFTDAPVTDAPKSSLPMWCPTIFRDGAHRCNANVASVTAGFFDHDGTREEIEPFLAALAERGIEHLVIPSPSHFDALDRGLYKVRILVPYSEPVSADEHRRVWRSMNEMAGGVLDTAPSAPSNAFYVPAVHPEHASKWWITYRPGNPLDVQAILASSPTPASAKSNKSKRGKCAVSGSSKVVHSAVLGPDMPMDQEVRLADGRTVAISELPIDVGKILCHAIGRPDLNPSAFVNVLPDGRVHYYDSGTGERRWWVSRITVATKVSFLPTSILLAPSQWVRDVIPAFGDLILRAAVGSGKSQATRELRAAAKSSIYITTNVSLVEAEAAATGATSYKDPTFVTAAHVAITINSLPKLPVRHVAVIVIDEATAVALAHYGKTAKGEARAWLTTLLDRLASADRVIVTCADLTPEIAAWWAAVLAMAGHDQVQYVDVVGRRHDREIVLGGTKATTLVEFKAEVASMVPGSGTRVLFLDSKKDVRALAKILREDHSELKILDLHADNTKQHRALLTQPNLLAGFDVVISTGVLKHGFSVEAQVARIYVIACLTEVTVADTAQAIARFRSVQDPRVRVCMTGGRGSDLPVELDAIMESAKSKQAANDVLVSCSPIAWAWVKGDDREPQSDIDQMLLDLWALIERQHRLESRDRVGEFTKVVQGYGWTISRSHENYDADVVEASKAAQRDAVAEVVAEDRQSVLCAAPIELEQYEELRRESQLTPVERAQVEAHAIRAFFGQEPTEETVKGGEKMRAQLSDLVRVGAWIRHDVKPAAWADSRQSKFHSTEKDFYATRTALLAEAMEATGISVHGAGSLDTERFEEWLGYHMTELQEVLGTKEAHTTRLFGKLVKALGGSTIRMWTGPRGARVAIPGADFIDAWAKADWHRRTVEGEIYALTAPTYFTIAA